MHTPAEPHFRAASRINFMFSGTLSGETVQKIAAELAEHFPVCPPVEYLRADLEAARSDRSRLIDERREAEDYLLALWRNGQLPQPMPETLRDRLAAKK